MGDYTQLTASIELEESAIEPIEKFINSDNHDWLKVAQKIGIDKQINAQNFLNDNFSKFIPFGGIADQYNFIEDDLWHFNCELKNYDDTVKKFIDFVDLFSKRYAIEVTSDSHNYQYSLIKKNRHE